MAHESRFYFLKPPGLPVLEKDNLLGRVVKNYANPTADYTPNGSPQQLIDFPAPPISSGLTTAKAVLSSSSQVTAKGLFTSLAALTRQHADDATVSFESEGIEVVRLQQHEETFDLLKAVPAVEQKLAKMIRVGGKAYLVVGLLIWRAATFSTGNASNKSTSASVMLPVGAALSAVAGGIPIPVGNVGADVKGSRTASNAVSASVQGEQIIGVEYRLIKRELLGFGSNTKISSGTIRYEGGKFYGNDGEKREDEDRTSSDDDDGNENPDLLRGVRLTDQAVEGCST